MSYIWDHKCFISVFLGGNLKIMLSYLKSTPTNLQTAKFREKVKMPKYGAKNALFGYILVTVLKNYFHISNQHLRICQIG